MNKFEAMREQIKTGVTVSVAPQLFPTPKHLAARMVDMANVHSFDQVLEPSAGTGRILDELAPIYNSNVTAIEIDHGMCRNLMSRKGVKVHCSDFLDVTPSQIGTFDVILMNPPFAKNADINHVTHAFKFLNEGGTLVAIMGEGAFFRIDKKANAFRELLNEHGYSEKLEQGTFKESGTMVNTRIIVMEK